MYSQSLVGFHILSKDIVKYCFPVSEEMIGISCESVCKVWMNEKYERTVPTRNETVHEHAMVRMVLDAIESNVDMHTLEGRVSPMGYIYKKSRTPT